MARSDLLVSLVKASVDGDKKAVHSAVEHIIAEEKVKQHTILADRLSRALLNGNGRRNGNGSHAFRLDDNEWKGPARDALAEVTPRRQLEELFLSKETQNIIDQFIEEQRRSSILRAHSIDPRHRIMLVGPPGNGKTSLAEAIAEALSLPFFVIRYEALIGSYLGETAQRLKNVFDYIKTTPCVVFFDEFDAVGKERGDVHETGEIKRVVSSLLMNVDELPSYSIIIAASNHAELLDRAVWRRFQIRINLPAPTTKELGEYLHKSFSYMGNKIGMSSINIAKKLGAISYAEAEEFVLDLRRKEILAISEKSFKTILNEQIKAWENRARANSDAQKAENRQVNNGF